MTAHIAAPGKRLGDCVVMLPVLQAAMAEGLKVQFVARSPQQIEMAGLVPGLNWIAEPDFNKSILPSGDRYHDFFAHPAFQTYSFDSMKFKQSFSGAKINDLLAIACRDFGIPEPLPRPLPLPLSRQPQLANSVLIVPGATSGSKRWPLQNWIELLEQLSRYFPVACLGQPERSKAVEEVIRAGVKHVATPTVQEAMEAVSSCRTVISVDTGLMHMAVHQNIPTIAMFNHHSIWIRPYPWLNAIRSVACIPECLERFLQAERDWMTLQMESTSAADPFHDFEKTWNGEDYLPCTDPNRANCMASIEPSDVVSLVVSSGI